jgi:hypothetical protein
MHPTPFVISRTKNQKIKVRYRATLRISKLQKKTQTFQAGKSSDQDPVIHVSDVESREGTTSQKFTS